MYLGKAIFSNRADITSALAITILVVAVSVAGTVLVLNSGLALNKGPSNIINGTQPNLIINGTIPSESKTPPINDQNDTLKVEPDPQSPNTNGPTIVEDNSTKRLTNFTLTVDTPVGSGSNTPESGNHTYVQGAIVQAEATPNPNWVFNYWLLDGSREYSNPTTIVMNASHSLKPVFTATQYNLTISVGGSGATNPESGIYTYINGTQVSINATASLGWKFDHWFLGGKSWTDNPTTMNMTQNYGLLAVFTQLVIPSPPPSPPSPPPVTVALTIQAPDGSGTTSPATGSHSYSQGANVQVTAAPSTEWQFDQWILDGSNVGSTNPITIGMNTAHTLKAVFTQIIYTLTVSTVGQGTISKSPDQESYASGTTVQLTATPAAGWSFSGWNGDLSGSTNPRTISMNTAKTVTATFTQNHYMITASAGSGGTITPSGGVLVNDSSSQTFTITPSIGYQISNVRVDGVSVNNVTNYTFSNVHSVHIISASFTQDKTHIIFKEDFEEGSLSNWDWSGGQEQCTIKIDSISGFNSDYGLDIVKPQGANLFKANLYKKIISNDSSLYFSFMIFFKNSTSNGEFEIFNLYDQNDEQIFNLYKFGNNLAINYLVDGAYNQGNWNLANVIKRDTVEGSWYKVDIYWNNEKRDFAVFINDTLTFTRHNISISSRKPFALAIGCIWSHEEDNIKLFFDNINIKTIKPFINLVNSTIDSFSNDSFEEMNLDKWNFYYARYPSTIEFSSIAGFNSMNGLKMSSQSGVKQYLWDGSAYIEKYFSENYGYKNITIQFQVSFNKTDTGTIEIFNLKDHDWNSCLTIYLYRNNLYLQYKELGKWNDLIIYNVNPDIWYNIKLNYNSNNGCIKLFVNNIPYINLTNININEYYIRNFQVGIGWKYDPEDSIEMYLDNIYCLTN